MPDSQEVKELKIEFESRYKELEKKVEDNMETVVSALSNTVTYKHFYWVIGVLVTILLAVVGFISTQISALQNDSAMIKSSVSRIDGKLEPYNIEFRK